MAFFLVTVVVMSDRSGFACRVKCVWSLSVRYVFTSETVFSAWVWASGLVVSCEIAKFGPDWRITEVRFESHLTSGLDQVIHETSHWEYINHFRRGSGRVFSGFGIWPKYDAGIGKKINILTGSGIWLFPGNRDSPKIGHEMRDLCLCCLSGMAETVTTHRF